MNYQLFSFLLNFGHVNLPTPRYDSSLRNDVATHIITRGARKLWVFLDTRMGWFCYLRASRVILLSSKIVSRDGGDLE